MLRSGRGGTLHPAMPWIAYGRMTDEDLRAIYRALRLLPPVAHRVHIRGAAHALPGVRAAARARGAQPTRRHSSASRPTWARSTPTPAATRFGIDDLEVAAHDGRLWITGFAEADIELVPVAGGRLRGIGFPFPVSFERDADGAVTKLVTWELGPDRWERAP